MKKLLVIISSIVICAAANAQETFYPGWNFGLQGGASVVITDNICGNFGKLVTPSAAINVGYEFTPWFGLRGDLAGWQGKGIVADPHSFNYVQLGVDAMFDICNIFKFRSERGVSPYIFVGPALNVRFNNGADASVKQQYPETYWDKTVLGFAGRYGVGMNVRLSDAVKIFLELTNNLESQKYNSVKDTKFLLDQQVGAYLGLKFTFGQAKKKAAAAAACAAEAAAAKAAAEKAAAEKAAREKAAREKAAREKAAAEKAAAEKAAAAAAAAKKAAYDKAVADINAAIANADSYPRFIIGRYNITKAAKKKVAYAAEIIKANPDVKVVLTGYADKETGSAAGNWKLSEKRANAIAEALVEAGIPAAQLSTAWKGDTEVPFEGAKPAQKRTVTFKAE